jgi:anion-transporting  ArsA/GET3 family ATPase
MPDETTVQGAINTVTINPLEQEQCVLLHFEGHASLHDANEALEHVGQLLDARGWKRLIVDATGVTSTLPTMDLYECASQSLRALPKGVRIALVIGPVHVTDGKFMEDVARNRSLPLTVFVDAFDARAWLEKECPE